MSIKRNRTAVILVYVGVPLESVKKITFLFKKEKNPLQPELLKKIYTRDSIELYNDESSDTEFTMQMRLKPDETYNLTAGKVYMDTELVLNNGTVPNVPIETVEDIQETLFKEVYKEDDSE